MAIPPRLRGLSREATPDAPAWWTAVLTVLSTFFSDITGALDGQLTRRENMRGDWSDVEFTTRTVVSDTYPILVKNRMPSKPSLVWLAWLERDDGAIVTEVHSMTARMQQTGEIGLYFQGLSAGIKYRVRIAYE